MEAIKLNEITVGKMSDTEVIRRILSGEKELFEILMRRYNQTLYRVIRSYMTVESDVEDAMQEAYLKAYEKLDQFRGNAAFSTWLVRIGMNEALQRIRKNKRIFFIDEQVEASGRIIQLPDNGQMNPEKNVIKHETRLMVEKSIDQLSEKYRVIFMLHQVEGMSNTEIAAALDLTESNVKVRLHRAKKMLKEELFKQSVDVSAFEFGNSRCDRIVQFVMDRI
ncbi:RNA polymerase sigma factor [uncultured Roseivirga sp.]|uniref:RNA polymerase sigma factor n=1 Tax=uncultured Roseivirga sp. TaxID=543088 RepID=UPI0030D816AC|tara:strand:+ start:136223 stop:136888 length:666 start_codon:yes stop_codon:yes gene_type:complete